jgi:hypothetical protein
VTRYLTDLWQRQCHNPKNATSRKFAVNSRMALSTFELLLLTFGICASVHIIAYLIQPAECAPDGDCREIMNEIVRHKFFHDNSILRDHKTPYFHWDAAAKCNFNNLLNKHWILIVYWCWVRPSSSWLNPFCAAIFRPIIIKERPQYGNEPSSQSGKLQKSSYSGSTRLSRPIRIITICFEFWKIAASAGYDASKLGSFRDGVLQEIISKMD